MPAFIGAPNLSLRLPTILAALLLLSTCLALAWQTQNLLHLLRNSSATSHVSSSPAATPPTLEKIASLFGSSASHTASAQPTTLDLTLHGSFVHSDPSQSSVILQHAGQAPQRYLNGAKLNEQTRIRAIYADHIELERNGKREQLSFPRSSKAQSHTNNNSALEGSTGDAPDSGNEALLEQRMEELRQQMEAAMLEASNPTESPEGN